MKFLAVLIDDSVQEIENLVLFSLNRNESTPVDSATFIFIHPNISQEIKSIRVKDKDDEIVFDGIVDEQHSVVSSTGVFLKIYARSKGAYLVDNQALPRMYTCPSLSIIFDNHIRPYGFENIICEGDVHLSSFNVLKGMSEWDVLNLFCIQSTGNPPRITQDGTVVVGSMKNDEKLIFSNDDGIPFTDFKYSIKRYRELSEIYARVDKEGSYSENIVDEDAVLRGIVRKRYINPVNDRKESIENAQRTMETLKRGSKEIKIKALMDKIPEIGTEVAVESRLYGYKDRLYISDIKYQISGTKRECEITLREGDI